VKQRPLEEKLVSSGTIVRHGNSKVDNYDQLLTQIKSP